MKGGPVTPLNPEAPKEDTMEASEHSRAETGYIGEREGVSFSKQEGGGVTVRIAEAEDGVGSVRYVAFGPREWADIVASCSARPWRGSPTSWDQRPMVDLGGEF